MQDFRFALRQLIKTPGFTAIAVLTLALAIGVNSAIVSLVNGVILRPIVPLRPGEMVNVFTARQNANRDYRQFSHTEYRELRNSNEVFAEVAAMQFSLVGVGREEGIRRSFSLLTSENFFSLMGAKPARGRFYTTEECRPNANIPVVVTSYAFWKRMGGRGDFVGSTLYLNHRPYTVIGIAPEGFSGISALLAPDVWLPLGVYAQMSSAFSDTTLSDLEATNNYTLNVVGRLRPGLNIVAAKTRLPALAQRLTALQPADPGGPRELQIQAPSRFSISTTPSDDGPVNVIAVLLMAMAGAVLFIASLNLANMLLARGTTRAKEIALRLALGASRWRVVRQLLSEGLVLALAGGVLGLILSHWSNGFLVTALNTLFSSMNFSITMRIQPDLVVIGITFVICLFATLLFSLGPALKSTKADLVNDLKQQVGEPAHIGRLNRFFAPRHLLVMTQIALSLMLLFASGLFFRGALKASGVALGFDPAGVLVSEMDFTLGNTDEAAGKRTILATVQRVHELPGVRSVAVTTMIPYGNFTNTRRVMPASAAITPKTDPKAPDPGAGALYASITAGYFDAIGAHILRGRDFTAVECENKESPRVAIVDETLAAKLFPNGDALGQHIRYTQAPSDGSPAEMEIVGIVNAHRNEVQDDNLTRRLFVPLAQAYNGNVYLVVRTAAKDRSAVVAMLPTLRQTFRAIDPDLPILRMLPFTDLLEKNVGLWIVRLGAVMFGVFGGIALLLAVVGVYGVKSYAVARRTREIGIRMALGANSRDVFSLIMKQGALQAAFALGVGLLLALGAGRVLAQILYQVSPADPLALLSASALLGAAALLACFIPARRATRVSPMTALRME
jgi:putative ABC transport system permease protein